MDTALIPAPVNLGGRPHKTPRKPTKRLTDADKAFALRYDKDGLTQVEIAQRLGCDQTTISRWLATCQDTSVEAGAYFRGRALSMAEKIHERGRASDLIKVLEGIDVLKAGEKSGGITINVGGDAHIALLAGPRKD